MIGINGNVVSFFSRRQTSKPSSFGIITSRRMRSGRCCAVAAKASSPSAACKHSYPWLESRVTSMSRLVSLSSTMRIRACLFIAVSPLCLFVLRREGEKEIDKHDGQRRCSPNAPGSDPCRLGKKGMKTAAHALSRQILLNLCQKLTRAERFCYVAVAAGGACFLLVAAQRIGCHHDDRDAPQIWVGLEAARRLVAFHSCQLDIHENQVRPLPLDHGKRRLYVLGLDILVARASLEIAQDLAIIVLVLNDENAFAHCRSACRSTRIGTVNENVEPQAGLDSTHSR